MVIDAREAEVLVRGSPEARRGYGVRRRRPLSPRPGDVVQKLAELGRVHRGSRAERGGLLTFPGLDSNIQDCRK